MLINQSYQLKNKITTKSQDGHGSWNTGYYCPNIFIDGKDQGKASFVATALEHAHSTTDQKGWVLTFSSGPGPLLKKVLVRDGSSNKYFLPFKNFGTNEHKWTYTNPTGMPKYLKGGVKEIHGVEYHTIKVNLPYKLFGWYINDRQGKKIRDMLNNHKVSSDLKVRQAREDALRLKRIAEEKKKEELEKKRKEELERQQRIKAEQERKRQEQQRKLRLKAQREERERIEALRIANMKHTIGGIFKSATTGSQINNTNGFVVTAKSKKTGHLFHAQITGGKFVFEGPNGLKKGDYIFSFSTKVGNPLSNGRKYVAQKVTKSVIGDSTDGVFNFVLNKNMSFNKWRFVLTWDRFPQDLDSTMFDKNLNYIVNYHSKVSTDSSVKLDVDARKGYGPETITFTNNLKPGEVRKYYVHQYSTKKGTLATSGAKVIVYNGNRQVDVINIPTQGSGRWWHVLNITANGIKTFNTIGK